jgi:hypothetical protein
MRARHVLIYGGGAAVIAALLVTDPDHGLTTGLLLLALVTPLIAVGFAHIARKGLHDYPEADMRELFRKAGESPIGAGLALVALAIVISALLGLFGRAAHAQPHPRAVALAPVLTAEIDRHWPDVPRREYIPALISHESCITYTHSRCWAPTSRLLTQREEGAGLGQLTRAWHPDGRLRFDALAEMRDRHPALRELDWATIYQRPDLQVRALVLMSRGNWQALRPVADPMERLAMTDAAYNGGLGGVQRERRACQLTSGCDPGRWWGHVEAHCLKSRVPLYSTRSACDINRHHVADVWKRMPRYQGLA